MAKGLNGQEHIGLSPEDDDVTALSRERHPPPDLGQ